MSPIIVIPAPLPLPSAPVVSTPQPPLPAGMVWDYLFEAWSPSSAPIQPVPPGTQVKLQLDTTLGEVDSPQVALDAAPIYVKTDNNGFWSVYLVPNSDMGGGGAVQAILATAAAGQPAAGDTGSSSYALVFQAFQWGAEVTIGPAPSFYLDALLGGVWTQIDGPIGGSGVAPQTVQSAIVEAAAVGSPDLRVRWAGAAGWGGSLFITGVLGGPVYRVQTSDRVYRVFVPPAGGQSRKLVV